MTKDEKKLLAWGVGIALLGGLALASGGDAKTAPAPSSPPTPPGPERVVSVRIERPNAALAQPPGERPVSSPWRIMPEDRATAASLIEEIVRRLRDRGYAATLIRFRYSGDFPPNQNLVVAEFKITGGGPAGASPAGELGPGLTVSLGGAPPPGPARAPAGYDFKGPS